MQSKISKGHLLLGTVFVGMSNTRAETRLGLQKRRVFLYGGLVELLSRHHANVLFTQVIDKMCKEDINRVLAIGQQPRKNGKPYVYFHQIEITTAEWAQVRRINVELEVCESSHQLTLSNLTIPVHLDFFSNNSQGGRRRAYRLYCNSRVC